MKRLRLLSAILVCSLSAGLWLLNMSKSPVIDHDLQMQRKYLNSVYDTLAPDLQEQRILAMDYWLRYPDVRNDSFWGEDSRLGIQGPADHYKHHGRREGRIYARVMRPDDMVLEKELAELYWRRNPDVAGSSIWGREGALGLLGPRDHYRFFGKHQGRKWGK
ncbi:hypothetical protein LA52FAK_41640 [Desulforhopalus sp. 52FAK]